RLRFGDGPRRAPGLALGRALVLPARRRRRTAFDPRRDALALLEPVDRVGALASSGARVMALGGDHAITYPVLRAQAAAYPGLTIVHFDAHPDLYDEFEGDRLSHASPFARIMEQKLAARLVQVGIRTLNAPQRAQVARFGVELVEMKD